MKQLGKIKEKLLKYLEKAFSNVPKRKMFYQIYCNLFRVNKKIVLIEAFHGQNISDSSLEFAKEIIKSYPNQYKIYFATENLKSDSQYIKSIGLAVKLTDVTTLRYPKILATAGYILTNASLPIYFMKREGQTYLQTWHGTPLKTLGKEMRMGIESMYIAQHSFLQADYLTEPNEFTKDIIMKDYNLEKLYTGKVVMAGYPRNRIFMLPDEGDKLRKKLGLEDKTIYVYMPTWRGTSNHTVVTTDYADRVQSIFNNLDKQLKDDQIFYVKFHPILRDSVPLSSYKHIVPFPNDVEPYEFISSADALITDYSSVFFDFSLTKKPIILFMYDFDEYMHDRGINMDIRDLPFRQIYSTEELGKCLANKEYENDKYENTEYFNSFFKYDSPDVTKKLLNMVFTGDESDFEVYDYSFNKNREIKIYMPTSVKTEADLKTLSKVCDENSVVIFYRKWFKNEISQILHDKYNYDFDYLVTTPTVPRTFLEQFLAFVKFKPVVRRLHRRDIKRLLPNLNVQEKYITDFGTFETGCNVAKKDTETILMKEISETENGCFRISFEAPSGYELREAVVLSEGNAILQRTPIVKAGEAIYDLTQLIEEFVVFRKQNVVLGVIAETDNEKKLFVFSDPKKEFGKKADERASFSLFYSPIIKNFNLPVDYFRANLPKMVFSLEEKTRKRLDAYDMTKAPAKLALLPFIDTKLDYLKIHICPPELMINKMSRGAKLKKVSCHKNTTTIKAFVSGVKKEEISKVLLELRSKTEDIQIELNSEIIQKKTGCIVKVKHSFDENQGLKEIFWDVRIVLNLFNTEQKLKITTRNYFKILKLFLINCQCYVGEKNIIFPYFGRGKILCYTFRKKNEYDTVSTRIKEFIAFAIFVLFGWYFKHKKLRIIFEKFCRTAQDNSYYFFKYCMDELPAKEKKNIFYVIDKSAPDYQKIKQYDSHVIQFMSIKHMIYAMACAICISTDSTSHFYLWRTKLSLVRTVIKLKKNELFLQHGVIALKQVHAVFGKRSASPMKYFVSSSQEEHDIIVSEFGYKNNEVPTLGLCRWDVLVDKSGEENEKMILLMPTWRSWLEEVDDSIFIESDYYKNYSELLTNSRLAKLLKENETKLVLYLHPKFAEYAKTFEDKIGENIVLVPFGEKSLNDLLMKCNMLITDYSSVCWDALYINKPVLFYQFDYERYNLAHGSYINMEKDLPGDRSTDLNGLLDDVEKYLKNGLKIKPEYSKAAYDFFMYHDHNNCKRTFEFIKSKGL